MNDLIKRVTKMETILDNLTVVVEKSDHVMNELMACLPDLDTLRTYYESQYMQDVLADQRNEIPKTLKRGVLSEDAVHILLVDLFELSNKMTELSKRIK